MTIGATWLLCLVFLAVFLRDFMWATDFVVRRIVRRFR
jgi:hypothetical protein